MPAHSRTLSTPHLGLRLLLAAVALFALVVVPACEGRREDSPAHPGPRIVATTGMIADLARTIAGDRGSVIALMGEGVDPHLYKPGPSDVQKLMDADVVLYNGLHLEGRMGEVLESLGKKPATTVIAVAERLDPARLLAPPEVQTAHDPHVWFDVMLWHDVAGIIRDALAAADPGGKPGYDDRARALQAELAVLDAEVRAGIATIPEDRRVLITAHDAFGYFGRAYDLEVLAIQGISTDSEAGLKDINRLVDTIVNRKVPAVFFESSVPRKAVDALVEGARARGHDLRIGGELFSDAMGPAGTPEGHYLGMVRHNVRIIVEGLGGRPADGG